MISGEWEWDYAQPAPATQPLEDFNSTQEYDNQPVKYEPQTSRKSPADARGTTFERDMPQDNSSNRDVTHSRVSDQVSGITHGLADAKIDSCSKDHRYPAKGHNSEDCSDIYSEDYSEEYPDTDAVRTSPARDLYCGGSQPESTQIPQLKHPATVAGSGQSYYSGYQSPPADTPGYEYSQQYPEQSQTCFTQEHNAALVGNDSYSSPYGPPLSNQNNTHTHIYTRNPKRPSERLDPSISPPKVYVYLLMKDRVQSAQAA